MAVCFFFIAVLKKATRFPCIFFQKPLGQEAGLFQSVSLLQFSPCAVNRPDRVNFAQSQLLTDDEGFRQCAQGGPK